MTLTDGSGCRKSLAPPATSASAPSPSHAPTPTKGLWVRQRRETLPRGRLLHTAASLTHPHPQEGLHPQRAAAPAQHLETLACAIISSSRQEMAVLLAVALHYELAGEGASKEREKQVTYLGAPQPLQGGCLASPLDI